MSARGWRIHELETHTVRMEDGAYIDVRRAWALLLWVGFACTWTVVRAVQMERRFQREDREQAAREGRVL